MIYTLTLAPTVDCHVSLKEHNIGKVNRPYEEYFLPGGKGVNVSKVLKVLNIPSICLGFLGGFTGKFVLDSLKQSNIKTNFVITKSPTRVCLKVETEKEETAYNPKPFPISKIEYNQLFKKLELLKSNDILIISGSLPEDLDLNKSKIILDKLFKKNVKFVFDTSSKLIKDLCKYKPLFVKPNKDELEHIFDTKIKSDSDVIKLSKQLIKLGALNVITSLGGKGSILVTKTDSYKALAPAGKVRSTVGSGDSMVAGFIETYLKSKDPIQSIKKATACGSATAFEKGLVSSKLNINKLMLKVKVVKLK